MSQGLANSDAASLLAAFARSRTARGTLLQVLGCPHSNRDPLAEFSECFVATLVGGTLARHRVQRGYDLIAPDGTRIQVKYLANASDAAVNWHHIHLMADQDAYVLVLFEDLAPVGVIWFTPVSLALVGARIRKRHGHQDTELQITRRDYQRILRDPAAFGDVGLECACSGKQFDRPAQGPPARSFGLEQYLYSPIFHETSFS